MLDVQKKSVKVGKLVDTHHVDTVIRNYKRERWVPNSNRLGKEDSLSVWYSVEELEEFFQKVKESGGDGIRMYFGAYKEDYKEQPLYAGRQTVVLVATKERETAKGEANKDLYISNEEGTTILAYNAGKLCPPFCNDHNGYDGGVGITILDKGNDGFVVA